MYLNKAFIAGNLTRDPELKSLPSGVKVCTFSVATNRYWKDQATGERKEATDYHNIVVFARQAETVAQYMKKGSGVLVEGRMQTRSWDAQDGQKKYRTEVIADKVQFGNRSSEAPSGESQESVKTSSGPGEEEPSQDNVADAIDTIDYPDEDINPEDIPF
ncbi:MAG: single-strand DNA-binding protein [Planctomycetota bacterium]|jgi:single-strand DNA-binding protein